MEDTVGKLGLQDFFNVLVSGILGIGVIVYMFPEILNSVQKNTDEYNIKYELNVLALVMSFVLGILFQEIGNVLDSCLFRFENKIVSNFLKFDYKSMIGNDVKFKLYRKYGKKILKKTKSIKKKCKIKDFTNEQCGFIHANIYYYLECLGKVEKYEKMRAIYDFCRTILGMLFSFVIFSIIGVLFILYTGQTNHQPPLQVWV